MGMNGYMGSLGDNKNVFKLHSHNGHTNLCIY